MDSRTQPKTLFCLFTILILGFVASLPVTIDAAGQLGDDDDHGDDPAHATPIALDTPVNGVIGFTNDVDYFSFDANHGETVIVSTTGKDPYHRSEFALFDTDGVTLLFNTEGIVAHMIAFTVPESGRFFVRVRDGDNGFYTLKLTLHEDDHGNSPERASPIELNTPVEGVWFSKDDVDWFSFDAVRGDNVIASVSGGDSYHRVKLTVFDTDRFTRIAERSSYDGRAALPFTVPESGRFFVRIAHTSFLFSMNSKFLKDLDNTSFSEELRQEFKNNGISLQKVTISKFPLDKQDRTWEISDLSNGQRYFVRKNNGDELNIFDDKLYDGHAFGPVDQPIFYTLKLTSYADDHGNSLETATPVELNTSVKGVINAADDVDWFRFEANGGDRVIIDMTEKGSALRASWSLFDANGTRLKDGQLGAFSSPGHTPLVLPIPSSGQYFVQVRDDFHNGGGGNDYFYTLKLTLYEDDYGDDSAHATPIAFDTPVEGRIGHWGDVDWFSLDANRGTHVTITISGASSDVGRRRPIGIPLPPGSQLGNEGNTLFDTDGVTPLNNFRHKISYGSGGIMFFQTFPENGRYFVQIQGDYGEGYGLPYTLTVYADDHGNRAEVATSIELNTPVDGVITPAGDVDWFSFDAQSGQTVRVATTGKESALDVLLTLFDTDGTTRLQEAVSYDDFRAGIAFTAPKSGRFFVQVQDYNNNGGADRSYTLKLTPYEDDHGDDPEHATPVPLDTSVEGVIGVSGDEDWFSFEANREDHILITTTGAGSALEGLLTLTDGIKTISEDYSRNAETNIFLISSVRGRYFVKVKDSRHVVSGSGGDDYFYTLKIARYENDHGDGPENATPIVFNTPVDGVIGVRGLDADWFRFYAVAGDRITIEVSPHDPQRSIWLSLVGRDGGTRVLGDNTRFSKIENFSVPEDGTYFIEVTVESSGLGSYTLTVRKGDSSEGSPRFNLTVPKGLGLIHIPLKVMG